MTGWAGTRRRSSSPVATSRTRKDSPGPRWPGWPKPTTPSQKNSTTPSPRKPKNEAPETKEEDKHKPLAVLRREAILAIISQSGARRVGDLGCGAGVLTRDLLSDQRFEHVTAVDVSVRALQLAARDLKLDQLPDHQRQRLTIFQSSLTYRDDRLAGLDAAVLMEVIEHLDPDRIPALERVVFGEAAPGTVVVSTPNAEYNVHFIATMAPGTLRHRDHRFEWTRAEFRAWAERARQLRLPGPLPARRPRTSRHRPAHQLAGVDRAAAS